MGSPVCVVVSEILMQNIEKQALATYIETATLRWRYDHCRTRKQSRRIPRTIEKQNTSIQFTKEIEENANIPFLDCSVTRENNTLRTTVYRNHHILTDHLTKRLTIPKRDYYPVDSAFHPLSNWGLITTIFDKNVWNTRLIKRVIFCLNAI